MFNKWKVKIGIVSNNLPKQFVDSIFKNLNSNFDTSIIDNYDEIDLFEILICELTEDTQPTENRLTIGIYQTPISYYETVNFRVFDPENGNKADLTKLTAVFEKYFIAIAEELDIPSFKYNTNRELL